MCPPRCGANFGFAALAPAPRRCRSRVRSWAISSAPVPPLPPGRDRIRAAGEPRLPVHPSQSFVNAGLNRSGAGPWLAEALMEPQCVPAKSPPRRKRRKGRFMTAGATRGPNFAVLAGLAWLVIAIDLIARYWAGTALTLSDTDDAMRLAEMHDFLRGPGGLQGWFDMHQARLAPPAGY